MKRHHRSARPPAEAERLREVFAEAAYDVTPSPVPLAAIERAGRRRARRRAVAVAGSACAVLVLPPAVLALREGVDVGRGPGGTRVTSPAAGAAGTVRVVAPGERVRVASGIKVWLTEDGAHWVSPWSPAPRFHGVGDDGTGSSAPAVTLQEEGDGDDGYFLSGVYHGRGDAARVTVETTAGDVDGTVLTLAGGPRWGVWYALVRAPGAGAQPPLSGGPTRRVTVYDSTGGVIAAMERAT